MTIVIDMPTWRQFRDWLHATNRPDRLVYRGMVDSNWEIRSSAERIFGPDNFSHLADEALAKFERLVARRYPALLPGSPDELEALAQHNGLPTQLVDWSESPYIAAYFAFVPGRPSPRPTTRSHVAIWALSTAGLPTPSTPAEVSLLEVVGAGNSRLDAQYGLFTRVRGHLSLSAALTAHGLDDSLMKIRIPAREQPPVLADLSRMGISPDRLFPDLGGLAEKVIWELTS